MKTPIIKNCESFTIYAAALITTTCDDFDGANKCLKGMLHNYWSTFRNNYFPKAFPEREVVGCYTNYDPDTFRSYDFVLGFNKYSENKTFSEIIIPAASYLVFTTHDTSVQSLVTTWGEICRYFSNRPPQKRAFSVDFEIHKQNSLEIYISTY